MTIIATYLDNKGVENDDLEYVCACVHAHTRTERNI